ncbi:MAG: phage major capsid protein [Bauldia sp.]|nr:phage major capsid protein [Bauldia sp.]
MLESVKISRRQSEIRQALAGLVGKEIPTEDETRSMTNLEAEYATNETRYRAALIAEDSERREAGDELETRSDREYAELIDKFELRQVALALDEGRALDGATAEIVSELREQGGYRGVPVPWQALEKRAGETVASGTPNPLRTMPIIDRIFADSAAVRMGATMINIDSGAQEWPVVTSSVTAGWADGETASVAGPTVFATTDKALAPNSNLGITMKITRKTLKQSGAALEQAVRRDMNSAIGAALDKAVFLGTGANGQPGGVLVADYGINDTDISGPATWAAFRAAVTRFIVANAVAGPGAVKMLIRPEIWAFMDDSYITIGEVTSGLTDAFATEWNRLTAHVPAGNIVMSSNALAAPTGGPPTESTSLLTTTVGGVAPIFVGTWGAIDLIRDPYSDAASGGLRLTALTTADVTVARPAQLEILTGLQDAVDES